jgi:hypothetical protein
MNNLGFRVVCDVPGPQIPTPKSAQDQAGKRLVGKWDLDLAELAKMMNVKTEDLPSNLKVCFEFRADGSGTAIAADGTSSGNQRVEMNWTVKRSQGDEATVEIRGARKDEDVVFVFLSEDRAIFGNPGGDKIPLRRVRVAAIVPDSPAATEGTSLVKPAVPVDGYISIGTRRQKRSRRKPR